MKGMRLVGPKKMIYMPAGTIFIEYWMSNQKELKKVVDSFINNSIDIDDWHDIYVYKNNSCSWCYPSDENIDEYTLIDINIVGDADPENTVYLIIEDTNLIPQPIRGKVLKWQKILSKENKPKELDKWVLDRLNKYCGEYLDIDIKGE